MRIAAERIATASLLILGAVLLPCNPCRAATDSKHTKQEETKGLSVAGDDPRAFADARDLYASRKAPLIDETQAMEFVAQLSKAIAAYDSFPEGMLTQTRAVLSNLDGARMSNTLYEKIRGAAESAAARIAQSKAVSGAKDRAAFKEGCAAYEKGKFADAAAKFRSAVTSFPKHLDARNNLALSEMRAGNNVVALYHLEILMKLAPDYRGAVMNLSVVFERLGMSELAYEIARKTADDNSTLPMAQYNAAWFENARGQYTRAQSDLKAALTQFPDYPKASRLFVLNSLEAGTIPAAEQSKGLQAQDVAALANLRRRAAPLQSESTSRTASPDPDLAPEVPLRTFRVSADNVLALDADKALGTLPVGSSYMVSETVGDWLAVYWCSNGVKRRVWLRDGPLPRPLSLSTTVPSQSSAAPAAHPPVATPPPEAATNSAPSAVSPELAAFLGVWGERWGDGRDATVFVANSITVTADDGKLKVAISGNWKVSDAKIENGTLSFGKRGGDSGWELIYEVKPDAAGKMGLTVHRVHDGKTFSGELYR